MYAMHVSYQFLKEVHVTNCDGLIEYLLPVRPLNISSEDCVKILSLLVKTLFNVMIDGFVQRNVSIQTALQKYSFIVCMLCSSLYWTFTICEVCMNMPVVCMCDRN